MTAREYLDQYKEAVRRIRRYEEEYREESLLVDAIRSTSDNDGMPHGTNVGRPTEEKAIRLADKRMRLIKAKIEAIQIREEIFDTIMSIGGFESEVLLERFVYLREWMDICKKLNYTWTPVRLAWHRGEAMIQEIIDNNRQE